MSIGSKLPTASFFSKSKIAYWRVVFAFSRIFFFGAAAMREHFFLAKVVY